ncbi:MAG: RnfABCDGE type electron transport complex subunit D, partial [Bacillota bacterium]|nr:RnfABCDGE type electron transport complex subunit D [Bacillota bacterium]
MPETAEEAQKRPEGERAGAGEAKLLTVASSPHLLSGEDVPQLMYGVALALLPALAAAVFLFGWGVLGLVAAVTGASLVAEAAFQRARGRAVTISDGSALVTGLLLALTLPPRLPIWMGVVGGVFAIVFGKQIYGGLGSNPFNPALVGRVFLMVAFPVAMTTWTAP